MKIKRALVVAAIALSAFACGNQETSVVANEPVTTTPSDDEVQYFAATYLDALLKPNAQKANQMVDWEGLLERATADGDVRESWRRAFIKGATSSGGRLVENITQIVGNGGKLTLLSVRRVDGEKRIVLRLLMPDRGVNYYELPLVRDRTGFVRARDIYIYASGEYLSDSLRRLYLMAIASDPSLVEKLSGKKNTFLQSARDFKEMMEKVRNGDGQGAIAIYRRLPENMRREKAVMVAYVTASGSINDDAAYLKAMDELRAAFPNERGLDLMFVDSHILSRRYDQALATIDRIDESVGGDPYLDVLRSEIHAERGDLEKALQHAERACSIEPDLEDAWWARVTVALTRKDHAETARLLAHIRDELEVEIADLTTIPEYAEFVRSPEYRQFSQ